MITKLLDYFCHSCGGWFRSSCPHGPSYDYCGVCGWWTKDCGH